MTLKTRTYLFYFFFLIFIIATPLISLYASGYKLGKSFKLEKTGILILDSEPQGAKIYIDSKAQKSFIKNLYNKEESYILTPAKIKNISPGKHNIKFEHENYWAWQKNLEVRPGESTFAEDVNLFKKDLPFQLVDGKFDNLQIINKEKIALINENIKIYNQQNDTIEAEIDFDEKILNPNDVSFSKNGDWILIKNQLLKKKNDQYLIQKTFPKEITDIKFNQEKNQEIFYKNNNSLSRLNIDSEEMSVVIKNNALKDFLIKNNTLFFIEQNSLQTKLIVYNPDNKEISKEISLPSSEYIFLHKNHKYINLYDKKHEILYIIDPNRPIRQLLETINNVKNSLWNEESKLLYSNDFEIWTLDLNSLKRTLLTRISDKLTKVLWHHNNNYILYSTANSVNVIELDDRDHFNTTRLFELNEIKEPFLNENGEILYFLGKIGKQDGLYKLLIQ